MLILLYYTLYKQDDLKTPHFIWFSVQAVAVFILTNSRASFILSVMLIISSVAIKAFNSKYRRTYMSLVFIAILSLAVIWFILVLVYDPDISILNLANRLTSGRVRLSHDALSDYPPSLFGSNITFPYYVDPLYTYTLVIYGFFGLISFLLMFYKGAFRSFKQGLPFLLISILIFQLYNTQENVFLYHLMDITMYSAACQLE
ncbi:MAG: hypothetical protein Q4D71_03200 [Oscillospiraceae bacterium]|nr:hypothetical protein [Oscillospiraceae bacterium]